MTLAAPRLACVLTALMLILAGCANDQPSSVATAPSAQAPPAKPIVLVLPDELAGYKKHHPPATATGPSDFGMQVSLAGAFPASARSAGGGYVARMEGTQAELFFVGIVVGDFADPQQAIENAFASLRPGQSHASLGLAVSMPRMHTINAPSTVDGRIVCGLADGGNGVWIFPVCGWAGKTAAGVVAVYGGMTLGELEAKIFAIRREAESAAG